MHLVFETRGSVFAAVRRVSTNHKCINKQRSERYVNITHHSATSRNEKQRWCFLSHQHHLFSLDISAGVIMAPGGIGFELIEIHSA